MIKKKKYVRWTNHQVSRLQECFGIMSNEQLAKEFAPRSLRSIETMAYNMGLRRPHRQRCWKTICAAHKPMIIFSRGTV